jgi:hypothetical protein
MHRTKEAKKTMNRELEREVYTWLRAEMRRCITVNEGILAKGDPNDEELEDAYGIKTGIEYVFWLMDVGLYQPGTEGRADGPLHNMTLEETGQEWPTKIKDGKFLNDNDEEIGWRAIPLPTSKQEEK